MIAFAITGVIIFAITGAASGQAVCHARVEYFASRQCNPAISSADRQPFPWPSSSGALPQVFR
jgi:hypothetical protein